jgi:hypothetical protein
MRSVDLLVKQYAVKARTFKGWETRHLVVCKEALTHGGSEPPLADLGWGTIP